ncbi:GntR family transcriptional regulator [Microtetraspora sp. NBRC 13810]|uniref:FadR/GntR family transcriptional regulator n=1 Tax=Microtetraspora sp. NBRC 13810 TaxID=3030990 RepID=UPI0024A34385|nr:GntR family transcriptional regulator [Microtetraspora sp. NBRC 13810]GLW11172.1 GntR family transcriptional regulator [Microtetraspora sp. NBRC 13810]
MPPVPRKRVDLTAPALAGIRRLSALDTVRARIALAVDLGLLKPGERLPPNADIAAALDVSDITVRRALVSLCEDGVLRRVRGRTGGTLVADEPARGIVSAIAAYRESTGEVHRLIDHRVVLECGLAHLAALTAPDDRIGALADVVAQLDEAKDWADFHALDQRFHLLVAETIGLAGAVPEYRRVLHDLYQYYLPYPVEYLRESNEEHRELVGSLRARDPRAAVDVARRHVEVLHRTMFVGLV